MSSKEQAKPNYLTKLASHKVLMIGGEDRREFLNRLLTIDMPEIGSAQLRYGGLLSPQGKLLADFLIFAAEDAYYLDMPEPIADQLLSRLKLYRLRTKVTFDAESHGKLSCVAVYGENPLTAVSGRQSWLGGADPRMAAAGLRYIVAPGDETDLAGECGARIVEEDVYHQFRVRIGLPEGGWDFDYGAQFPTDINMDLLGGISLSKGCFIGQEVVSRMHHRANIRRRVVNVGSDTTLDRGAEISIEGRRVGHIGSVGDRGALALVRIDKIESALETGLEICAGKIPLHIDNNFIAAFSNNEKN